MNQNEDYKPCPICEQGVLFPHVYSLNNLELHYSICSHCLSEQADHEQIQLNKKIAIAHKYKNNNNN